MPYIGYGDLFTCIQFRCPTDWPNRIYNACVKTQTVSQTRYIQEAVCEKLARDTGQDLDELLDLLPAPRGRAKSLFDASRGRKAPTTTRVGSADTIEEVI